MMVVENVLPVEQEWKRRKLKKILTGVRSVAKRTGGVALSATKSKRIENIVKTITAILVVRIVVRD